jgi:hypothetical protein
VPKREHSGFEKAQTRPEQNQRGQYEFGDVARLHADGSHDEYVDRRKNVGAHLDRKNRRGQDQSQDDGAMKIFGFRLAPV